MSSSSSGPATHRKQARVGLLASYPSQAPPAACGCAPRFLPFPVPSSSLTVVGSSPPAPLWLQQQLVSELLASSFWLAPAAGRQQQADCGLLTTSCSSSIKVYSGAIKFYLIGSRSLQATDFSILVFFCMLFLTNFHLCYVFDK